MPYYMRLGSFDITIDEQTNLVTNIELNYHQDYPVPITYKNTALIGNYIEVTLNEATKKPFSNVENNTGHVKTKKHDKHQQGLSSNDVHLILQTALHEISAELIYSTVGRQLIQIEPFQTQLAQTIGNTIVSWCEQALQNTLLREQQLAAIHLPAASSPTSTVTTPPASPPATTTAHSTSSGDSPKPLFQRRNAAVNITPLSIF